MELFGSVGGIILVFFIVLHRIWPGFEFQCTLLEVKDTEVYFYIISKDGVAGTVVCFLSVLGIEPSASCWLDKSPSTNP